MFGFGFKVGIVIELKLDSFLQFHATYENFRYKCYATLNGMTVKWNEIKWKLAGIPTELRTHKKFLSR